jgi:hypothetical protein
MAQSGKKPMRWLLLVHHVPAQPLYLRAKIRRLLDHAGGIALKRSVYALPPRAECREAFERIASEAAEGGGQVYVCHARFLDSKTDQSLVETSRSAREKDYNSLAEILRELDGRSDPEGLARARERFRSVERIDFFEALGRRRVEALLARLEEGMARRPVRSRRRDGVSDLVGRVWATRRGVQIDRIASAWLIRRFIDESARFRFIDPTDERKPGELRFDMVGGDFTHVGDACTFETLVRTIRNPDPGLRHVAEIVHDIDLKDGKFGRPDAAGVQQIVLGIVLDCAGDEDRLDRGFALFDDLYASFRRRHPLEKEVSK